MMSVLDQSGLHHFINVRNFFFPVGRDDDELGDETLMACFDLLSAYQPITPSLTRGS